jgi:hypothetical protein
MVRKMTHCGIVHAGLQSTGQKGEEVLEDSARDNMASRVATNNNSITFLFIYALIVSIFNFNFKFNLFIYVQA